MSVIDSLSLGGTTYSLRDNDGRAIIAGTESSTTSAHAYSAGDYFILNDTLYEATAAIAVGGAITVGTNCQATTVCGEVGQLKSETADSTGNAAITQWSDGHFVSTNGDTYNPNNVIDNASFRYAFIDCQGGDKFTIFGTGGGNPRLWAFVRDDGDTHTVLSPKAAANATANGLVIVAPEGATRLVLNDNAKNHDSYYGELLVNRVTAVEATTSSNTTSLNTYSHNNDIRLNEYDGNMYIDPDDFEIGNITMTPNGWEYDSSTKRVRTKQGVTIHLNAGDIIRLTDYTNARMYIGFQLDANGSYGASGEWVTSDYFVTRTGNHVILLAHITEVALSSKHELLDLLRIYRLKNAVMDGYLKNHPVCVVNHRGYNESAPENTIPAFKLSKKNGFDYVETDVWFTSDGVGVLLHDGTVDRTSNGTGNIWEMTYEQARALDFGSWFSSTYTGTKIPSFEEFIALCRYVGLTPEVELKGGLGSGTTEARIKGLVDIAIEYGMQDKIVWASYTRDFLGYVLDVYNSATICLIKDTLDSETVTAAKAFENGVNKVIIATAHANITDAILALVNAAQLPLQVYTINTVAHYNSLVPEAQYVITDRLPIDRMWIYSQLFA